MTARSHTRQKRKWKARFAKLRRNTGDWLREDVDKPVPRGEKRGDGDGDGEMSAAQAFSNYERDVRRFERGETLVVRPAVAQWMREWSKGPRRAT